MKFKKYHKSKNLIVYPYYDKSGTISNVLWTVSEDGHIKGVGTTSSGTNFFLNRDIFLKAGTYTIKIYGKHTGMTFRIYDSVKQTSIVAISSSSTDGFRTFTLDSDTSNECRVYFNADGAGQNVDIDCDIMLNEGSTPQPYEPYSSEVWHDIPYYQHKTATDTLTLPAVIYPNDTSITVGIKGNTTQSGTPTPQNPVDVLCTGERTDNLFDKDNATTYDCYITSIGQWAVGAGNKTVRISCASNTQYTLSTDSTYPAFRIMETNSDNIPSDGSPVGGTLIYYGSGNQYTFTTSNTAKYIIFQANSASLSQWLSELMFNTGSTVLPYEPYGYKIPISMGGTTNNVYLGKVQTTRKIRKLVLTGEESWNKSSTYQGSFYARVIENPYGGIAANQYAAYCSHAQKVNRIDAQAYVYGKFAFDGGVSPYNLNLFIGEASWSKDDFKAYLAQQYANGTPVTVWYILANETTGITNEPLMKIGTYADSLTTSVSCTAGENTLDVQTTVAPSEVTATFEGWHPVSDVHVYPDSSWMPTSWEEFRKAVRFGKAQSLYPVGTKLYEQWGDDTSNAWIVVDYPNDNRYIDTDLAQQGYTNRVMLIEEKINYLRVFDSQEAWLYAETAIPAGTYRFTIPNYDTTYGGNKTYIFTSTADVPVGGQLTLTWAHQQNPSAVQAYSSSTDTSSIFNVSITEWDGTTPCTDLGTIKLAMGDADSTYGKLNHIHRARYGSNNYAQSGIRQWLNSDASANAWWQPTTIFDRPYSNRNTAGRLNTMNSDMKSVIATPTINCITNNLFESSSLDGTTFALQTAYTVKDKLFPVTHTEVNLSSTPNVDSILSYYTGAGNAERIKYRADNGNAYYWWLRTPLPTDASHERLVRASGALSSATAHTTYGGVAACIIQ